MPVISIVIPNYNGLKYIEQCLDSIMNQSFKDFEVIIVDNNSQDESCKYILGNYPEVKLIRLDNNYGFSKAVNQGIKESSGEYVVLVNNDTDADKHWLENLVHCIKKDEKIFSCCSKMIRYYDRDKVDDAGDEYSIFGWALKRGEGSSVIRYSKDAVVFSCCAGAAIYRKKIFEEIGYFDENFFAYLEDMDISYRANIYGYKNVFCSDALIYHIGSATTGSRHNAFKVKLAARNNIYLIYKNMPMPQLIINVPFLIIGHLIKHLYFVKKGLGMYYRNGIAEAFKNLKLINKIQHRNSNFFNYLIIEFKLIVVILSRAFTYISGGWKK